MQLFTDCTFTQLRRIFGTRWNKEATHPKWFEMPRGNARVGWRVRPVGKVFSILILNGRHYVVVAVHVMMWPEIVECAWQQTNFDFSSAPAAELSGEAQSNPRPSTRRDLCRQL